MKKNIHVNPIAVIISNPERATRGEKALREAHHNRLAAKHAVKTPNLGLISNTDTAIAHAMRVAEACAAAKAATAKARKAAVHAEKIGIEAAAVKAIGKAIAVKYGKTAAQFRAAFLRIVEETVVKHGHKIVLRPYGADVRVGSSAARRAEKFAKTAKFAVDYSVTALIDKGWDAINAVSTVVNHDLTALRDALKERGKINCFAPLNKKPIFEMKLQLFAKKNVIFDAIEGVVGAEAFFEAIARGMTSKDAGHLAKKAVTDANKKYNEDRIVPACVCRCCVFSKMGECDGCHCANGYGFCWDSDNESDEEEIIVIPRDVYMNALNDINSDIDSDDDSRRLNMSLQLFAQSNPADKAVGNKAGSTGEKGGAPMNNKVQETKQESPIKTVLRAIKENDMKLFFTGLGFSKKQVESALNSGIDVDEMKEIYHRIVNNDKTAECELRDLFMQIRFVGPKTAEEAVKILCGTFYSDYVPPKEQEMELVFDENYPVTIGAPYDKKWHTMIRGHYNKYGRNGKKNQMSIWKKNPNFGKVGHENEKEWVHDKISYKYSAFDQRLSEVTEKVEIDRFKAQAFIDESADDQNAIVRNKEDWAKKVDNGIYIGSFDPNFGSTTLVADGHGTNAGKKCEVLFMDKRALPTMDEFCRCGANPTAVNTPNKKAAYDGLLKVYTTKIGLPLQPEDIEFFDGAERVEKAFAKYASLDGVEEAKIREVMEKLGDGAVIMHVTEKKLREWVKPPMSTKMAKTIINNVCAMDDFTIRGPKLKGCVYTFFDIHAFLHDNGIHEVNGRDIDDIVMFADWSVLKAKVRPNDPTADYDNLDQWRKGFHDQGHRFGRLLGSTTNAPHDLPYQAMLHLTGADDEIVHACAQENIDRLLSYKDAVTAARRFLPKAVVEIVEKYPSLIKEEWFLGRIMDGYARELEQGKAGTMKDVIRYHFAAPDMIALVQVWFGLEVTGCIEAGQCYTCALHGEGAVLRNPILDGQAIKRVTFVNKVDVKYRKYFKRTMCFMLNTKEYIAEGMQCDFDGDKLGGTINKALLALIDAYYAAHGKHDVVGFAPKANKIVCDRAALLEYLKKNTQKDQLGRVCDLMGSLLANGKVDDNDDTEDFLAWLAGVIVDLSKSGNQFDMRELPDEIMEKLYYTDDEGRKRAKPYPKAMGMQKMIKDRTRTKVNALDEYGRNPLDIFGKYVTDNAPKTLEMDLPEDDFDYRILMADPFRAHVHIAGIVHQNKEKSEWSKICSMRTEEWNAIKDDKDYKPGTKKDWRKWKAQQCAEILLEKCRERRSDYTMDDAYDCVLTWMFNYCNHEHVGDFAEVLWASFWEIFGEKAVACMQRSIGEKVDVGLDLFDDEPDVIDLDEGDD